MSTDQNIKDRVIGSQKHEFLETGRAYHFPCGCGWAHVCLKEEIDSLLERSNLSKEVDKSTLIATGCFSCAKSDDDIKLIKADDE